MGLIAMFGIENSGLALAVNLLLLFLVVIWLALVYWTYSDARRRIADPMLVACATAASLFPFIGTIVYLIVRPPEYLEDVRERQLEIAAAQARLAQLEHQHCQYCGFETE
jgi:phosphoglycerol transferase MdoB-like AlkP superfamily enzyme